MHATSQGTTATTTKGIATMRTFQTSKSVMGLARVTNGAVLRLGSQGRSRMPSSVKLSLLQSTPQISEMEVALPVSQSLHLNSEHEGPSIHKLFVIVGIGRVVLRA